MISDDSDPGIVPYTSEEREVRTEEAEVFIAQAEKGGGLISNRPNIPT